MSTDLITKLLRNGQIPRYVIRYVIREVPVCVTVC